MTATTGCGCGIPNRANYYTHVTLTREGETTDTDVYTCAEHTPADADPASVRQLLEWDGSEDWAIVEVTQTELR